MKKLIKNLRIQSLANPNFKGIVIEISSDGLSGYIHFDSDEEKDSKIFYHVSELEIETK